MHWQEYDDEIHMMEGPGVQINLTGMLTLTTLKWRPMLFFQIEIIINVLAIALSISFEYTGYGSTELILFFYFFDFRRQNFTFIDVRF